MELLECRKMTPDVERLEVNVKKVLPTCQVNGPV